MTRRYLFLLSSARPLGNALTLARAAAAPLPAKAQHWIDLTDPPLPAFLDLRPGFALPQGPLATILHAMRDATEIILVAPIYWYALPAPAKLLMDHWSGWLDAPATEFAAWAQDKTFHLITTRADPDPSVPDLTEAMVKRSILWLGMGWGGALHGIADAPGDISADHRAMQTAAHFLPR